MNITKEQRTETIELLGSDGKWYRGDMPRGVTFNPAAFITIVADSIDVLRRCDVYRLLDEMPPEHIQSLSDFIRKNRIDLTKEVSKCLADIERERSPASSPSQTNQP